MPYGFPDYGGGGFGMIDPSLMVAIAQRPELASVFDNAGIPPPKGPMNPNIMTGPSNELGDILSGLFSPAAGPTAAAGGTPAAMAAAPQPTAGWQATVTPEGAPPGQKAGGVTPQVAKPTPPQEPPRLVAQNAPQVGKAPGNPLMDLLLSTLLSGSRPGLGGGRGAV